MSADPSGQKPAPGVADNAIAGDLDDVPLDLPLDLEIEPLDDDDEPAAVEASDVIRTSLAVMAAFGLSVAIWGPGQAIVEIAGGVCYLLTKHHIVRDDAFAERVREMEYLADYFNAQVYDR